ncbi:MAG: nicotinate-nucleotide adenylyltransferase [Paludibacteraceae bacterium]|nr:nicotinate-nucleotide adenylyltransferase [Paludibacteraceae bacterium]
MNIALFFGSFNPIHLGHTKLADYIVKHHQFDEAWFVVSPTNPLKINSDLADENLRLKMLQLAICNHKKFKACDIEFSLPRPSFTENTLNKLRELYPQHQFTLVIGADNLQLFEKWKNYKHILETTQLLVYPRTGYSNKRNEPEFAHVKTINAPLYEISSTQLRNEFRNGIYTSPWINKRVLNFIMKHKIY